MLKLPPPDEFGNFFLGHHGTGPAIFPSKRIKYSSSGEIVLPTGTYIATLGARDGFLFDGPDLRQFETAEEALAAINAHFKLK